MTSIQLIDYTLTMIIYKERKSNVTISTASNSKNRAAQLKPLVKTFQTE